MMVEKQRVIYPMPTQHTLYNLIKVRVDSVCMHTYIALYTNVSL